MAYDFSPFKKSLKETEERLVRELMGINTGRATPAILDNIQIESYGAMVALKHSASVTIEDPKTLRAVPWDTSLISKIETAIRNSGMGFGISSDSQGVRVTFPALTTDQRQKIAKLVRAKMEDSRVAVRQLREEAWSDIQEKQKSGDISEDEKFKGKEDMQKLVDEANNNLEMITTKKEKEVLED